MSAAFAPGRVNLIGDHTDYVGGLAVPMAIDLGTTAHFAPDPGASEVEVASEATGEAVLLPLDGEGGAGTARSPFARLAGSVVAAFPPPAGGRCLVRSTLPVGAGLSSSTSLVVALALALGAGRTPRELAIACQKAEEDATGVPGGLLDQLAICLAEAGKALLLDFATLAVTPVPFPPAAEVAVVHSGVSRSLAASGYATRRAQCEAAACEIGPLRTASAADVESIGDPLLRRRARHVVTENARVLAFAEALRRDDLETAGALMDESHASLRDDFAVSSAELERAVAAVKARGGVLGARLTGAGFGGCVVALCETGSFRPPLGDLASWVVRPGGPARLA